MKEGSPRLELFLWFIVATLVILFASLFYLRKKFNDDVSITLNAIQELNQKIDRIELEMKRQHEPDRLIETDKHIPAQNTGNAPVSKH